MKPMTDGQVAAMKDRFNANAYNYAMRSRIYAEMRDDFIRDMRTQTKAKVFRERSADFKCIVCGASMAAQRSTKQTCSARCRTRLSRLVRATNAAETEKRLAEQIAEDAEQDHTRLSRVARAERPTENGDGRFVLV